MLDLSSYAFEASIPINGTPEGIIYDGQNLWVAVPHADLYYTTGNTVAVIDPTTNAVVETIDVGEGPQQLTEINGEIYVSRTFYDSNWNTFHGASKITSNNN